MVTPSPVRSFAAVSEAPYPAPTLPALASFLAQVPDRRQRQGRRHPLGAVLCLICAALLAGRDTPQAIHEWGRQYPPEVMTALGFRHGKTPCASTLHLVLKGLHWEALERQLRRWAETLLLAVGAEPDVALAADGKALRGSLKQGSEVAHLLSVVVHGLGITLSHEAVSRKSNEIPALPVLLARLILSGRVLTVDALLTQREIATQLLQAGADYLMVAKGNQPTLRAEVQAVFAPHLAAAQDRERHETFERGHGRLETRRLTVVSVAPGTVAWPGVAQVFVLERITGRGKSARQRRAAQYERTLVWGVTSLPRERAGAKRLLALSRGHWGIENGSHWVRDCVFHEDARQVPTGTVARAMAAFRSAAISLLRAQGEPSITTATRRMQARPWDCLALLGIT
jgi:predicted transposase YbfD/YdcC